MLTAFHQKSLKFASLQRIEMLRQLELVNLQSIPPYTEAANEGVL